MARSQAAETQGQDLTATEQAEFDAMRDADTQPVIEPEAPQVEEPQTSPEGEAEVTETRRNQTVPLSALHEERERRKQSDQTLAAERERLRILEERTNLLLQNIGRQQQPQVEQPQIPDPNADPVGHILATLQAQQQELAMMRGNSQHQNQIQQQALLLNTLQQRARAMETEFVAETPDYDKAIEYLVDREHRVLAATGITDRLQRNQIIQQRGLEVAAQALQKNANPAQMLYEIAKINGYVPPDVGAGNGQPGEAAQQRIENIATGQRQNRTLGGTRGAAPTTMTAQRLIDMSPADFDKALQNPANMGLLGT